MKKRITLPITLLALAPLMMALPFAMDIYVPAVPRISALFHISDAVMQLTLNLFMLVSGIMQLVIGPLSDAYGRRSVTLLSIVIFSIGCLTCAASTSITQLILGRFIEAVGACGMMVLGFAIARDLYADTKLAKVYSILNGLIAFSPMFAPFIGSFLDIHFGWPMTFESLLVFSILAVLLYFPLLPETCLPAQRQPITRRIFINYSKIFLTPIFFFYSLAASIGLSYLFIFCATSPVILIKLLHIPEADFGYYFCFMGLSFFIGSIVSVLVVGWLKIYRTVMLGFMITLIGGIIMAVWYYNTGLTLNNFIWPMLLIGLGATLCMGAGSAGAMQPFATQVGMAAALSGGMRFAFSALLGLIISPYIHSVLPLAVPALVFSVLGFILFAIFAKRLQFEGLSSTN